MPSPIPSSPAPSFIQPAPVAGAAAIAGAAPAQPSDPQTPVRRGSVSSLAPSLQQAVGAAHLGAHQADSLHEMITLEPVPPRPVSPSVPVPDNEAQMVAHIGAAVETVADLLVEQQRGTALLLRADAALAGQHDAAGRPVTPPTAAQLSAIHERLATIRAELCAEILDLRGAAVNLIRHRAGEQAAVGSDQVAAAIDTVLPQAQRGQAASRLLFTHGPDGAAWPAGAGGQLDQISVTFDAAQRVRQQLESAAKAAPEAPEPPAALQRLDAGKSQMLADLDRVDAGLVTDLLALVEAHPIELPDEDLKATALAAAIRPQMERMDDAELARRFGALERDAMRCDQVSYRIGHEAIVQALEAKYDDKRLQFYMRALGGEVVPAFVASSMHSLAANLAGVAVSGRPDYDPGKFADRVGKAGAASGAALGAAVPLVNHGVVPSVIAALELVGARTLVPSDPLQLYAAPLEAVCGDDFLARHPTPATLQRERQTVDIQRANFSKKLTEYTFGGTTGKTVGYVAYGVGNGVLALTGVGGSVGAKALQTGLAQAAASTVMVVSKSNQRIDGFPAYTLGEAKGKTRITAGMQQLNPTAAAPSREFLASVAGGIQAVSAAKLIGEIPDAPGANATVSAAAKTGAGLVPLLVTVFGLTENNKPDELARAADAGVIDATDPLARSKLAVANLQPKNWDAAHRTHFEVGRGTNVFATANALATAGAELLPTITGDLLMRGADLALDRTGPAPAPGRPA